jgi:hypothetical protein
VFFTFRAAMVKFAFTNLGLCPIFVHILSVEAIR